MIKDLINCQNKIKKRGKKLRKTLRNRQKFKIKNKFSESRNITIALEYLKVKKIKLIHEKANERVKYIKLKIN